MSETTLETPVVTPAKKRIRRTPEQIIADLKEKIARAEAGESVRATKSAVLQTLEGQKVVMIGRAANALIRHGQATGNSLLVTVGNNVNACLAEIAVTCGITLPSIDEKRGRKPKSDTTPAS